MVFGWPRVLRAGPGAKQSRNAARPNHSECSLSRAASTLAKAVPETTETPQHSADGSSNRCGRHRRLSLLFATGSTVLGAAVHRLSRDGGCVGARRGRTHSVPGIFSRAHRRSTRRASVS
ncbi:hypothetical protein HPB50_005121 [Hyalomma asiaticum]|uniref:Uncharacterized protein n=1 Tax=Hyalomma asiaticum TaxID=266040 RepID=A0ACB7TFA8_HYAAI|nr:hypothetical protein HPB50_005121 [Hyalomma asiaticum]